MMNNVISCVWIVLAGLFTYHTKIFGMFTKISLFVLILVTIVFRIFDYVHRNGHISHEKAIKIKRYMIYGAIGTASLAILGEIYNYF